jgi:hypothetical protein
MTSPNRAEINRANARHSTGPKTAEGKQTVSLNSLRHGLTGQIVVMPGEDIDSYKRHVKSFTDEYNPQGATEAQLVQAMADASWRLNRAASLEANLLTFNGALASNDVAAAVSAVARLEQHAKTFNALSVHTQRLSRQFERTLDKLREIQQARRAQEQQDLDKVVDLTEIHESKGETYRPSDDGFVFSEAQITAAIRRRKRERVLEKATKSAAA